MKFYNTHYVTSSGVSIIYWLTCIPGMMGMFHINDHIYYARYCLYVKHSCDILVLNTCNMEACLSFINSYICS